MGEMKMKDGNVLPSENSGAAAGTSENLTDGRTITRDKFEMVGKNIEKMESISRPSLTFCRRRGDESGQIRRHISV